MDNVRVVFMGTPDFSVPVLEGLIENYNVVGVVTQPDKEVGRKKEILFSPVKKKALEYNIPVLQPLKVRIDYEDILDYPSYGCINVHASLLPKLRGGAPIHHAIMDGYDKTGVTIMYMNEAMDGGNIITQDETLIEDSDTVGTLHDRLSLMGKELLLETLPSILAKTNPSIPQNEKEVTFGYNIKREEEWITFNHSTREVFNHIRGLNPFPGGYALLDQNVIKLYDVKIGRRLNSTHPGEILSLTKEGMEIATLDGSVVVTTLQFAGKKKMTVKDYLNGSKDISLVGKIFNEE